MFDSTLRDAVTDLEERSGPAGTSRPIQSMAAAERNSIQNFMPTLGVQRASLSCCGDGNEVELSTSKMA